MGRVKGESGKATSGAITIFMALLLMILVSLVSAGVLSVRMAAARAQILASMDIGLYSLFSEYDRALLDKYDIFALDADGPDGFPDMGSLLQEFESYAKPVLMQNSQFLTVLQSGFSGYALLTDDGGGVFFKQVVQYMKDTILAQGISLVQSRILSHQTNVSMAEEAGRTVESGEAMDNYESEMSEAARRSEQMRQEAEAQAAEGEGMRLSEEITQGGAEQPRQQVTNPIPMIRRIREMGILALVIQNTLGLSEVDLHEANGLVSRRQLKEGMGMSGWYQEESDVYADALFQVYIVKKLGSYRNPADYGLRYQLEYIIGGGTNDRGNLETVANRLLLIREGVNAAAIAADPVKMGQVEALSLGIASAFLMPPAASVVQAALVSSWAFGESVLDVRELFSGGRVPLTKAPYQWQLSLENLPDLLGHLDTDRRGDPFGLSYEDYLQVLLFAIPRQEKTMRTLDMVELSLREQPNWQVFHLDNCVVAAAAYMDVQANFRHIYTVDRMYGYQ